jgi:hypothetical protein
MRPVPTDFPCAYDQTSVIHDLNVASGLNIGLSADVPEVPSVDRVLVLLTGSVPGG